MPVRYGAPFGPLRRTFSLTQPPEGGQLTARPRRQPEIPRTLPLPHRCLPTTERARASARPSCPSLCASPPIQRVPSCHYQCNRRRSYWRDCLHLGLAHTLVAKADIRLQLESPRPRCGCFCCSCHCMLRLRAPAVAAVPPSASRRRRIYPGHKSPGLRDLHVSCSSADTRSRVGLQGLPIVCKLFLPTTLSSH